MRLVLQQVPIGKSALFDVQCYLMADLGKLWPAGWTRPFAPLCPVRVMPIINNINKTSMSFFTFILKFENLLFSFNICGDLYIIISHSIIKHYQNQLFKLFNLKDFNLRENLRFFGQSFSNMSDVRQAKIVISNLFNFLFCQKAFARQTDELFAPYSLDLLANNIQYPQAMHEQQLALLKNGVDLFPLLCTAATNSLLKFFQRSGRVLNAFV